MEIMGYSQINLITDTYSHVLPTLHNEAAGRMHELLSGS